MKTNRVLIQVTIIKANVGGHVKMKQCKPQVPTFPHCNRRCPCIKICVHHKIYGWWRGRISLVKTMEIVYNWHKCVQCPWFGKILGSIENWDPITPTLMGPTCRPCMIPRSKSGRFDRTVSAWGYEPINIVHSAAFGLFSCNFFLMNF